MDKKISVFDLDNTLVFTDKLNNESYNFALLNMGKEVHLVNGSKLNFKITTFDDLMMLKALLKIGKTGVM